MQPNTLFSVKTLDSSIVVSLASFASFAVISLLYVPVKHLFDDAVAGDIFLARQLHAVLCRKRGQQ